MFETSTIRVDDGSRLKLGAVAEGQVLKRNGQKLEGVSPSAPGAHAATHQNGGGDEVGTATPGANAIPKASAGGKLDSWISDAAAGAKGLIQLATDLGNTAAAPNVIGLQGSALPVTAVNQFVKRNAGNTAWEGVTYGAIANTICQGNDSRLSDARTPTAHHATHEPGGTDAMAADAAAGTASLRSLGSTGIKACAGNDSRLSDARTPTAHASTHQNGGTDEIAVAAPTANAIPKASAGAKLDSWISDAAVGAKGLMQLASDLGNTAGAPNVVGLQGSALPVTAADQFIKRNATNAAWEGVSYGSVANTVAQGNDARFGGTAGSVSRLIGANLTIAANYSMYVIGPAEVGVGVIVEIAAGAAVEVG